MAMKGQEWLTNAGIKYSTKPTFWTASPLKVKKTTLVPTAKALHRTMAQALAAGDKDIINRLCTRALAGPYIASIQSRPRGVRYGWELLGYTRKLFYPAIRSHKMSPLGKEKMSPIVRQAVVALSSKQRRVKYDVQGQVVPGSEKEVDVVEHVAMSCIIDPRTWQHGEWHFIGSVKPTTYEGWVEERKILKAMLEQN
jgi:protein MBA1